MISVPYNFAFNYPFLNHRRFPALQIRVASLCAPDQAVETAAYLDSGTELSLFNGDIARSIELDLLAGQPKTYQSTSGAAIEARLHRVRLSHAILGDFDLEVGFSLSRISRDLLDRDFFNCIQIGFRENQLAFYVTPTP